MIKLKDKIFGKNGISVIDTSLILDVDFNNNFTNKVPGGVQLIAGNVNGLPSFVSDGSGGYAVNFDAVKSLKTSANFPINTSDKVYMEFDMKTTATEGQVIAELSTNYFLNNSFLAVINDVANKIEINDYNSSSTNIGYSPISINTGVWINIKIIIDRSLGVDQNKIYINNVLSYTQNTTYYGNNNGNFGSYILYLGQRAGNSFGFVGQLKNLKIWNRILTQTEINNL